MKKLIFCLTAAILSLFIPVSMNAIGKFPAMTADSTKTTVSPEIAALTLRLEEINELDKSALSPPEKKELRKEVREIKKELKARTGGVYISIGALLVVILLLILLL